MLPNRRNSDRPIPEEPRFSYRPIPDSVGEAYASAPPPIHSVNRPESSLPSTYIRSQYASAVGYGPATKSPLTTGPNNSSAYIPYNAPIARDSTFRPAPSSPYAQPPPPHPDYLPNHFTSPSYPAGLSSRFEAPAGTMSLGTNNYPPPYGQPTRPLTSQMHPQHQYPQPLPIYTSGYEMPQGVDQSTAMHNQGNNALQPDPTRVMGRAEFLKAYGVDTRPPEEAEWQRGPSSWDKAQERKRKNKERMRAYNKKVRIAKLEAREQAKREKRQTIELGEAARNEENRHGDDGNGEDTPQGSTHPENTHLENTHPENTHPENTHPETTHRGNTHLENTHHETSYDENTHQENTHQRDAGEGRGHEEDEKGKNEDKHNGTGEDGNEETDHGGIGDGEIEGEEIEEGEIVEGRLEARRD